MHMCLVIILVAAVSVCACIHNLALLLQEKHLIAEHKRQQILQMAVVLDDLLANLYHQRNSIVTNMNNAAIRTKTGNCLLTEMEVSLNSQAMSTMPEQAYSTPCSPHTPQAYKTSMTATF